MNSRENGRSASNDLRAMGRWGLWSAYVDTAAGKDAVQSRGGFMNQVAFKDCGRVNFANTGHGEGVVQGIHTGRGMTAKCKIRNWDGQWHIVESR
jgi:hypothetical protein